MDDLLIVGNDKVTIQKIKHSIKDLGSLHYYLGIEFLRNKTGLAMSQRKYALDLITYVGLLDTKPSATPLTLMLSSLWMMETHFQIQHLIGL